MWNKVFNVNNPFWQSMDTVFDLFVLNLLWLICCIPIFTIGPATIALYYALIQKNLGEAGYLRKDFFGSFKRNFKQGVIIGLPLTLLGAFLTFDIYLCHEAGKGIFTFFMVFFAVVLLLWMFITLYIFPLLAKFEYKNRDAFIMAFTLSIQHVPMTIVMLIFTAFCLFFTRHFPGLIFIIFGIIGQFCARIMTSVFKPYLPKDEEPDYAEEHFYDFNPDAPKSKDYKEYEDYDNIQDLF